MIRICFVCHGNICRSPMAEFVMKKLVSEYTMSSNFYIKSAATHTDEIWNGVGNHIYPPAKRVLFENKIPFDKDKRATLLKKDDYKKYDYFIGMDDENIRFMKRLFTSDSDKKIFKLLDFTEMGGNVSDPWYTRDFNRAFDDIYNGCDALLHKFK